LPLLSSKVGLKSPPRPFIHSGRELLLSVSSLRRAREC